jgi:hypothetical protein
MTPRRERFAIDLLADNPFRFYLQVARGDREKPVSPGLIGLAKFEGLGVPWRMRFTALHVIY